MKPDEVIINGVTLADIIEKHNEWLNDPTLGCHADLSNICLKEVDLSGVNLSGALLKHTSFDRCDLSGVNLSCAVLRHISFNECDLSNANLDHSAIYFTSFLDSKGSGLSLRYAKVYYTDVSNTELIDANLNFSTIIVSDLHYSNLRNANLIETYTFETNWTGCWLNRANLTNAQFTRCSLDEAKLYSTKLTGTSFNKSVMDDTRFIGSDITRTKFDESSITRTTFNDTSGELMDFRKGKVLNEDIIGYKKCNIIPNTHQFSDGFVPDVSAIVTLSIPRGATVFSINGNKCRTNRAKVIAINDIMGAPLPRAQSQYKYMSYYVGDEFNMYDFDCAYNVECGKGIHFFMNKQDAIDY